MSDYSRQNDFSVKDALPTGDANKKIKGSEVDAEFDAIVTSNNTKADKVTSPTDGAYLVQDSSGNLADSGVVISSFADTVLDDADSDAARVTLDVETGTTGSLKLPGGTTAQRDGTPATGYLRYNSTLTRLEWYNGSDWVDAGGLAGLITTQGDLVRGGSGGAAERVALGTVGQVLASDGTDAAWADRVVSGTVQATTSGSHVDFTSLPSWVTTVILVVDASSLSGTDHILVQLGDSGGIETTGYVSDSNINVPGGAEVNANSTSGFVLYLGAAARAARALMTFVKVDTNDWVAGHVGTVGSTFTVNGGGAKTLSDTLTQLRVTRTGTDTFDAGQVNIVYF